MAQTKWPPGRWLWCRWKISMTLCNQSMSQERMLSIYRYFCHAWKMCWVDHGSCLSKNREERKKSKLNVSSNQSKHKSLENVQSKNTKRNYSLSAISAINKNTQVCAPPNEKPPKNLEISRCNGQVPNIKNSQPIWKINGEMIENWYAIVTEIGLASHSPIAGIQLKRLNA